MASLGQYQSFAIISYNAIKKQLSYVNAQIGMGCNVGALPELLYKAKNYTDTVYSYSTDCISVIGLTELDVIAVCDWICENVNFTTKPIAQLPETYLNGNWPDFNQNDFKPNDFA